VTITVSTMVVGAHFDVDWVSTSSCAQATICAERLLIELTRPLDRATDPSMTEARFTHFAREPNRGGRTRFRTSLRSSHGNGR
jgi:hypothetical protein